MGPSVCCSYRCELATLSLIVALKFKQAMVASDNATLSRMSLNMKEVGAITNAKKMETSKNVRGRYD